MAATIAFVFGAAMLAWGGMSVRRGRLWDSDEGFDGGWVERGASPFKFWLLAALMMTAGLLAIATGVVIVQAR